MRRIFIFAVMLFAAVACSTTNEQKAKHVFVVAFDGWGSYCMDSVEMPNTRAFMNEGSYTLQKRTVIR